MEKKERDVCVRFSLITVIKAAPCPVDSTQQSPLPSNADERHLQVALEEYKAVRTEIGLQLTSQNQIFTFGSTLTAAILALASRYEGAYLWVLLVAPLFFSALGMLLVHRDDTIVDLTAYQERVLKPLIHTLVNDPSSSVLSWHEFVGDKRYGPRRKPIFALTKRLIAPFPHAVIVALSWGAIYLVVKFCVHPWHHGSWAFHLDSQQRLVFWCDVVMAVYFPLCALLTGRSYRIVTKDTRGRITPDGSAND